VVAPPGGTTPRELERLAFLVRLAPPPTPVVAPLADDDDGPDTAMADGGGGGGGVGGGRDDMMEASPTAAALAAGAATAASPFAPPHVAPLASAAPGMGPGAPPGAAAPSAPLVAWLSSVVRDDAPPSEALAAATAAAVAAVAHAASTMDTDGRPVNPYFGAGAPGPPPPGLPAGVLSGGGADSPRPASPSVGVAAPPTSTAPHIGISTSTVGAVDVQGVVRATVARGEGGFPGGVLRVADCHDAVVYALSPLARVSIVACSDCTIVLGAVGRSLRLERCERTHVVAAAARVAALSCHDCVLSLGVRRRPLILGSSRGLLLAPHCAGYARLRSHMAAAGLTPTPNRWDEPVGLGREPVLLSAATSAPAAPSAAGPAPTALLAPDRFAPLVIPFVGGAGPLCGGAAHMDGAGRGGAADAGSWLGLGAAAPSRPAAPANGAAGGRTTPPPPAAMDAASALRATAASPFPLPPAYEAARDRKVAAIADLRSAVKAVSCFG
jgi:hypothetical protein